MLRRGAATGLILALAVLAGMLLPRPLWHSEAESAARRILLLSNPIHTDIALPIDAELLERFAFLRGAGMPIDATAARYIVFGWGSREFYIGTPTWSELKPYPLFRGLTLDRSAMHVDVAGDIPTDHPSVSVLQIGEAGQARLVAFIRASFLEGPDGQTAIQHAGYGAYDRFFEANGWFTAVLGCNTWTAKALREAGLQTGWWNPLPQTLRVSVALHN